jgi:hypothetical protein
MRVGPHDSSSCACFLISCKGLDTKRSETTDSPTRPRSRREACPCLMAVVMVVMVMRTSTLVWQIWRRVC